MRHSTFIALLAMIGLAATQATHADQFPTPRVGAAPAPQVYAQPGPAYPAPAYVDQGVAVGGGIAVDEVEEFGAYLWPDGINIPFNADVSDCRIDWRGEEAAIVAFDKHTQKFYLLWDGDVGPNGVYLAAEGNAMQVQRGQCFNFGYADLSLLGWEKGMFYPHPYGVRRGTRAWAQLSSPYSPGDAEYFPVTYIPGRPEYRPVFGYDRSHGAVKPGIFGREQGGIPLRALRAGDRGYRGGAEQGFRGGQNFRGNEPGFRGGNEGFRGAPRAEQQGDRPGPAIANGQGGLGREPRVVFDERQSAQDARRNAEGLPPGAAGPGFRGGFGRQALPGRYPAPGAMGSGRY